VDVDVDVDVAVDRTRTFRLNNRLSNCFILILIMNAVLSYISSET
jgi:hypothetical protein